MVPVDNERNQENVDDKSDGWWGSDSHWEHNYIFPVEISEKADKYLKIFYVIIDWRKI